MLPWKSALFVVLCGLYAACNGAPRVYLGNGPRVSRPADDTIVRVMTFNIAHGAGVSASPVGVAAENFAHNLTHIAALIRRENPDIIALQEVDTTSPWSTSFDSMIFLGRRSGFWHGYLGLHTDINFFGLGPSKIRGGAGLLAKIPLDAPRSVAFRTDPIDSQGFVVARVRPRGFADTPLEVIALHLNPESGATRLEQIDILINEVADSPLPRIVMGDFNSTSGAVSAEEYNAPLRRLCAALKLRPYAPQAFLPTFPADNPADRLDWILISEDLEFIYYETAPDVLSDHLPVVAGIALRDTARRVNKP